MGNSGSSGENADGSAGGAKAKIQAVAKISLAGERGDVSEVTEVTEMESSEQSEGKMVLPTFGSPVGEDNMEVEELDGPSHDLETVHRRRVQAPPAVVQEVRVGGKKKKKKKDLETRPMSEWSEVELLRNVVRNNPNQTLHQWP